MASLGKVPARFVVWVINPDTLDEHPVVSCFSYAEAQDWIAMNRRKGECYKVKKTPVVQIVPYTTFVN